MTTTPVQHPQDILAVFDMYLTGPQAKFPLNHGFTQFTEGFEAFCEGAAAAHVFAQREMLETNLDFRQLLMYTPIVIPVDGDALGDEFLLSVYQRKGKGDAKIGEVRLQDKFSVGYGGHPDFDDAKSTGSVISVKQVLMESWERELHEEIQVKVPTGRSSYSLPTLKGLFGGFLMDNTLPEASHAHSFNGETPVKAKKLPVGLFHVGIVNYVIAPAGAEVEVVEAEHTICQPMRPKDILESPMQLEPWSQMLVEWFATKTLPELTRPGMYCSEKGLGVEIPQLYDTSIRP